MQRDDSGESVALLRNFTTICNRGNDYVVRGRETGP